MNGMDGKLGRRRAIYTTNHPSITRAMNRRRETHRGGFQNSPWQYSAGLGIIVTMKVTTRSVSPSASACDARFSTTATGACRVGGYVVVSEKERHGPPDKQTRPPAIQTNRATHRHHRAGAAAPRGVPVAHHLQLRPAPGHVPERHAGQRQRQHQRHERAGERAHHPLGPLRDAVREEHEPQILQRGRGPVGVVDPFHVVDEVVRHQMHVLGADGGGHPGPVALEERQLQPDVPPDLFRGAAVGLEGVSGGGRD